MDARACEFQLFGAAISAQVGQAASGPRAASGGREIRTDGPRARERCARWSLRPSGLRGSLVSLEAPGCGASGRGAVLAGTSMPPRAAVRRDRGYAASIAGG